MENFVAAIRSTPNWRKELARRATFVERNCSVAPYSPWKAEVLQLLRGNKRVTSNLDSGLLERLGVGKMPAEWRPTSYWLSEVDEEQNAIDRLLRIPEITASSALANALRCWNKACLWIIRRGSWLEVDGCRWLWMVHRSYRLSPPEIAIEMREQALRGGAGFDVESFVRAAAKLNKWAISSAPNFPVSESINPGSEMNLACVAPDRNRELSGEPVDDEGLTVTEAARICGVYPGSISRAATNGKLGSNGKQGAGRRIDRADLTRWMSNRARRPEVQEKLETVQKKMALASQS